LGAHNALRLTQDRAGVLLATTDDNGRIMAGTFSSGWCIADVALALPFGHLAVRVSTAEIRPFNRLPVEKNAGPSCIGRTGALNALKD
jgi:hypothetical protein